MSSSSKQQKEILEKLRADKGKISNKEAKDLINKSADEANKIINNAEKTRKQTVREAEKTYQEKKSQYQKMHKDIPGYTKDMMDQDIANARTERDLTVSAAKEAKSKVVSSAKAKHDQVVKEAEKQNKSVSSNVVAEGNNGIRAYNSWGAAIHNTLKFLANAWKAIVKAFGGSYSASVDGYAPAGLIQARASGGVAKSGPSLVGEAGPELVYTPWAKSVRIVGQRGAEITHLKQGEQVLNASDTSKVLAGTYTGVLPGYAKGTDFSLGNIISGLKDKVLDIADSVLDTLKKPVEWINNGFKNWTSVQAFDFTKTTLMDSTRDLAKNSLLKPVTDAFAKLTKGYEESGATNPGGSGVERWIPVIKKAAHKMKVNLTESGLQAILRRIRQESNGSATVTNNWDSNAKAGHPSKGLLQYIQPTLNSWVPAGVKADLSSGYSQLMALFNDSNWLADISVKGGWGPTGHKRMANGGLVTKHQMIEIAENNMPEMVIPLDLSKRSRAYQLMQQSLDYFAKNDSKISTPSVTQAENSNVEQLLNLALGMMAKILGVNEQQLSVLKRGQNVDFNRIYKKIAVDKDMRDYQGW